MARKKSNESKTVINQDVLLKNKYGNVTAWMLFGLIGEIFFCLICGWLSGNTELNKISDNFVTSLLQNYNYILGAILLIPVILYIYSKIKIELKNKFYSDDQTMMFGFIGFIVLLIAIISCCSVVYPINSSTWYGVNSAVTVSIFLCSVITLIFFSIVYGFLKIPSMLKNKGELWKAIKRYSPIILMVMFLIWTFISCMLAPGAADDIIGAEMAEKNGASPDQVISKTLNGCYNLKDGFWAFLMYGSVMLAAMLIGKDKIKEKKRLIVGYVIVMTVLSVITIMMSNYITIKQEGYSKLYAGYYANSGEFDFEEKLTASDFDKMAQNEAYKVFGKWYIYPQRGVFRNSNHFAYVLCMAILAAVGLAMVEKNVLYKFLYIIAFTILTSMLIINNTFGGYLGVLVALFCLLIYGIASVFVKKKENEDGKDKLHSLVVLFILIAVFALVSFGIKGGNGKSIAAQNIKGFINDIGVFGGYMISEENPTEADVSTLDESITKAGSGRGETWIKVWELIKQRPMFGYGLECLLFQFSGQFNINEGRTHNLLLQLLATVGIPGTLMYFAALAIVFIRLLKNWKTWNDIEKITTFVGIAYMVTALTGNSTYYTSPYFMMFLGFVVLTPWKREGNFEE